jgi:hypothetical protein
MRAAIFAIAALLAGCHHDAPNRVTAETAASNAIGDASASSHVKDSGACVAIANARAAADAGTVSGALQNCMITKQGAWGVLVTSSIVPMYPEQTSQLALDFVHASGTSVVLGHSESWFKIDALSVFDFDGDGEEELVVQGARTCLGSNDGSCGGMRAENEILTFHSGKIAQFLNPATLPIPVGVPQSLIFLKAPAQFDETDRTLHIDEVTDVDGDGRPDLKTNLFYELGVSDGDVSSTTLLGPTFVAHSLANGTFSLTDAVAVKALTDSCAGGDSFEKSPSEGLFSVAICARLHGKGVAEISQRYTNRCVQIRAKYKQIMKDTSAGKPYPADFDAGAESACRTEPEADWGTTNGIPKALVKMLQQTQPLLAKP